MAKAAGTDGGRNENEIADVVVSIECKMFLRVKPDSTKSWPWCIFNDFMCRSVTLLGRDELVTVKPSQL